MMLIIGLILGLLIGVAGLYFYLKATHNKTLLAAEDQAQRILREAKKEAETLKKEKLLEAEEAAYDIKQKAEAQAEAKLAEIAEYSRQLDSKELEIDQKLQELENRRKELAMEQEELERRSLYIDEKTEELNRLIQEEVEKLEEIAGLTREEAKQQLIREVETEAREEGEKLAQNIIEKARTEAQRKAREIVVQAIEQVAAQQSEESTISIIHLPNDDMKGRIIGREGRNIRSFEMVTGVDVIIDDTPEIVVLSSFNSYRREIARRAMEKLVADGRIHPARIEEVVQKTEEEMADVLKEIGEQALLDVGVHGVHPELVEMLGKLKYRTAYGQNVLNHSIEVAYLSGIIATELGLEPHLAKRAGLFHDIGKAVEHYTEVDHAQLGADILQKYNEPEAVVNAALAHHDESQATTPYTFIVSAADIISGQRPGARRETLQNFLKRMRTLEEIAFEFEGVAKAYAIQAGREVRVMVETDKVDDAQARTLAREIARRIQEKLEFPWEIRVSVIREYRAYDFAT